VKSGVWVFVSFYVFFFNDKTKRTKKKLKRQEEFNVLIHSRLRITSLYVRCIPDIRCKDKTFKTSIIYQNHEATYLKYGALGVLIPFLVTTSPLPVNL
jgi:hypothetical protein